MDFRTNKCNHGQRARCINCLTRQLKVEKKKQQQNGPVQQAQKCIHPPNMKCLKCMSNSVIKNQVKACNHSNYQRCANCKKQQNYQSFEYFIEKLSNDCKHKKPCKKCVPIQARKTFGVDIQCKNHVPYPQAQCDACMAPTISIIKQPYSHVSKVIIKTTSVYRIIDANLFGILLGTQKDGIVCVQDIFFPQQQQPKGLYLSPDIIQKYRELFATIGYSQVGIIYSSSQITAFGLMMSSMFQQASLTIDKNGFQISKFITMRLHWDQQNPYFQCFMVSDQFQVLHRNNLIFQKSQNKDNFDLITAKADKNDKNKSLPTFLRQGVQTEQIKFKQIIVWIQTISEQCFYTVNNNLSYPFFTLQNQTIQNLQMFLQVQVYDPVDKYRNVQFLLHFFKLFGMNEVKNFINIFMYDNPQQYVKTLLQQHKNRSNTNILKKGYPFFGFK